MSASKHWMKGIQHVQQSQTISLAIFEDPGINVVMTKLGQTKAEAAAESARMYQQHDIKLNS